MIEAVILWFTTSKTGRAIAAGLAIAAGIGIAVLKVFNAGKAAEQAKQDRAALDTVRKRQEIKNEINTLDHDDLDKRGRRWVRPSE